MRALRAAALGKKVIGGLRVAVRIEAAGKGNGATVALSQGILLRAKGVSGKN